MMAAGRMRKELPLPEALIHPGKSRQVLTHSSLPVHVPPKTQKEMKE